MTHYYVYYKDKEDRIIYERTCGTESSANDRVKDLKEKYEKKEAWWQTNIVKGAFY